MLIPTILLSAGAFAAPALLARDISWTLEHFTQTCDGDIGYYCRYQFTIKDNNSGQTADCDYYHQVQTPPARYTDYQQLHCAPNSSYYINQGYNKDGDFIVVVPVNEDTNQNAFFGYPESQLQDGHPAPDQTSPSTTQGTWKRDIDERTAPGWTVKNLVKDCSYTSCTYTCQIHTPTTYPPTQACTLAVAGPPTTSFYSVPCRESPHWLISWGHNSQYNFAIATVVNSVWRLDAFFGFNNVGAPGKTSFRDVGPNPIYAM